MSYLTVSVFTRSGAAALSRLPASRAPRCVAHRTVPDRQREAAAISTPRLLGRVWRFIPTRARCLLVVDTVLNVALGFTASAPALVVGALVNQFRYPAGARSLAGLLAALGGLYATQVILRTFVHQSMHTILPRMEVELRHAQVLHSLKTPMNAGDTRFATEINSRLSRGAEGASRLVRLAFNDMLPAICQAAWAVGLAIYSSPTVGLVKLASTPLSWLITERQLRSQSGVRVFLEQEKAKLDGILTELLQGKAVVRSLDAVDAESARVRDRAQGACDAECAHHRAMGLFDALKLSTESLFALAVVSLGVLLTQHEGTAPGSILALYILYSQAAAPMRELHRMRDEANESAVQVKQAFEVMDEPEDAVYGREGALPMQLSGDRAVVAKRICAHYDGPNGDRVQVLRDVDLEVRAGTLVGICGPTGSGKSTLIKCICGLHDRTSGDVSLFERSLDSLAPSAMAECVAYASQQPYVLAGTVRDNLLFGSKRRCSDDEIIDALRCAALWDDIESVRQRVFPHALDTVLGEDGLGLSGGEKQRLVLARLILRRPRLMILDEATSALDNITEQLVMENVRRLGVSVVAIAHRLSTLSSAANILVLDEGKVVESGAYRDLVAAGGLFERLCTATDGGERRREK